VVSTITAKTVGENRYECAVHFRLPYADKAGKTSPFRSYLLQ